MRRSLSYGVTTGTLLLLLASCSGSSGSDSGAVLPVPIPVQFELFYPGNNSLTNASSVDVVNIADVTRITAVTIKAGNTDTVAALDADGRWRADSVPLQRGTNNLVAELTLSDGSTIERAIGVVQSSPVLSQPTAVKFDTVNNRVLIADAKKLLAYDVSTQSIDVISSRLLGSGPDFSFAQHLELAGDGAVLVPDAGHIKRVDPITGNRSEHIIFPPGSFAGTLVARDALGDRLFAAGFSNSLHVADLTAVPPILAAPVGNPPTIGVSPGGPSDATYVPGNDTVYTVNLNTLGVVAIDGSTGDSVNVPVGQGGPLLPTVGIDFDEVADRVLVIGLSGAVHTIDPATNVSNEQSPAPPLAIPPKAIRGLTRGDGSLWTAATTSGELIRIDSTSGAQSVEFSSSVGSGVAPGLMLAARFDDSNNRIVAVSDQRIVAIDSATGVREELASLFDPFAVLGQPPQLPGLLFVSGLALSQNATRAWVIGALSGDLAEVNLGSGDVQEISGTTAGSGPLPTQAAGLAVNPGETLAYVADRFDERVFRYNLATGQREVLPDFTSNMDPMELRTLVFDAGANRLLLNIGPRTPASSVVPGIYSLDLGSFALSLVADLSSVETPFGGVPSLLFPVLQMSLSEDSTMLFSPISGNPETPYAQIDLLSGTILPLGNAVSGPDFLLPNAIESADDGRLFGLDATSTLFLIDPATGERVIVSK
ncbi:MAG: hypothetical protein ACR2QR_06395 [Woeseiaceae bacterium]